MFKNTKLFIKILLVINLIEISLISPVFANQQDVYKQLNLLEKFMKSKIRIRRKN